MVAEARNLPGWDEPFAMGPALEKALDTKVRLGNDVQVAVDGEFALGAGRDSSLAARRLVGHRRGRRDHPRRQAVARAGAPPARSATSWSSRAARAAPAGAAAAWRPTPAAAAMEIRARKLKKKGHDTKLFKIMEKRGRTRLQSGIWSRALEAKDGMAIALIDRAIEALGAGVASAVNVLDVETVVIGGGLGTRLGEPYVRRIEAAMMPHLFVSDRPPAVLPAALGDLGGAVGATLLV